MWYNVAYRYTVYPLFLSEGNIMTDNICCFAGHCEISRNEKLEKVVHDKCEELIIEKGVNCFWVGDYGDFDVLAADTVRQLKRKYPHIKLELILPYITEKINNYKEMYYEKYDNIVLADIPERTPLKFRILSCNKYMVDNSAFLIAYVDRSFGGAVKTLEYAQKKGIKIFNLGVYKT